MDDTDERRQLDAFAEAVLENLETVARVVESTPQTGWQSTNVLANAPDKIADGAHNSVEQRLSAVQRAASEARRRLSVEPFVGRTPPMA
jgi:hypothetical protein